MATGALNEGVDFVNLVGDPIKAAPYFELARSIFKEVTEDERAGIAPADVADAWDGILRSYYWDRWKWGQVEKGGQGANLDKKNVSVRAAPSE